ncbi:MAG TPA: hypothetical protein VFZ22_08500 [Pyrinomonadaceae bacterium]|nr:hypothetical protein [Pyrinomonadaceae bacterium]
MSLHRIQVLAVAVVLFTLLFVSGWVKPIERNAAARNAAPAKWTFEGCWTQFSAGPCRDVYRDEQGDFWICKACGTTGNPGPGKCSPISAGTLSTGFWCS